MIRIRQTDDLESVAELDAELIGVSLDGDLELCTWWLAEVEQDGAWQPVGYMGAKLTDADQYAYISRMGVLSEARGQGLQRQLIRVFERWARRRKATWAWTYVSWDNVPSLKSFVRLGYLPYKAQDEAGFRSINVAKRLARAA